LSVNFFTFFILLIHLISLQANLLLPAPLYQKNSEKKMLLALLSPNVVTVQPCKFSMAYAGESLLSYAYVVGNLFGALPKRDAAKRNRAYG